MLTIYLDMDGVLADFDKKMMELFGHTFQQFPDSVTAWRIVEQYQDLYAILDPMPDALELVASCTALARNHNAKLSILTAVPKIGRLPDAAEHKVQWLAKHFSQYPDLVTNFNIGPHAVDKQNHCKNNDVLIDDSPLNIPQWQAKGGCGILHTNAQDSLFELYEHLQSLEYSDGYGG